MPGMSKGRRASGPWISANVTPPRTRKYTTDDNSRPCDVCDQPMLAQLLAAEPGTRTHPNCDLPRSPR